mmetsp:Transcript_11250/g.12805  ORF Transcript_11250/g.12805 Transcript_11250/m.12805 type:complete len:84 (+) Transcript_11250:26-277(+)
MLPHIFESCIASFNHYSLLHILHDQNNKINIGRTAAVSQVAKYKSSSCHRSKFPIIVTVVVVVIVIEEHPQEKVSVHLPVSVV